MSKLRQLNSGTSDRPIPRHSTAILAPAPNATCLPFLSRDRFMLLTVPPVRCPIIIPSEVSALPPKAPADTPYIGTPPHFSLLLDPRSLCPEASPIRPRDHCMLS